MPVVTVENPLVLPYLPRIATESSTLRPVSWVFTSHEQKEGAGFETYEVRNRVTLCRCGASTNKPFCDASHVSIGFTD
jgi:CDGSH-type Zn-finger protein